MIKIHGSHIKAIHAAVQANNVDLLFPLLQGAIELEHATVPPYLTGMFSLRPIVPLKPEDSDKVLKEVHDIIHSVVIEEMMHMCIACNILNALGGNPMINKKGFVPTYPGSLPLNIDESLTVDLGKYSKKQLHDVFMEIEHPEDPIPISRGELDREALKGIIKFILDKGFSGIGEFYTVLKMAIRLIAPDKLPGDPAKQVTSNFFPSDELFPILTKEDACRAIDVIIEQGEGTTKEPTFDGEMAHYYKFQELYEGRKIVEIDGQYYFRGASLEIDLINDVRNISAKTTRSYKVSNDLDDKDKNQAEKGLALVKEFNETYSSLLNGLHGVFNGNPNNLDSTIGFMFDLTLMANKICTIPIPGLKDELGNAIHFAPTFELN